jgi:PAS domain S-box-containing protein
MPACSSILDGNAREVLPQSLLQELFLSAPEGIVILDQQGQVLKANDEFCRMFGYSQDEVNGRRLEELIGVDNLLEDFLTTSGQHGQHSSLETVFHRKDGSRVQISVLGRSFTCSAQNSYLMFRDVTECGQEEASELRERLAQIIALADTAPSAIYIHTRNRFLYVNRATEGISGYSHDELLAMDPFEFLHPAYRALLRERWEKRVQGEVVPTRYEFRILSKVGEERWVDFSGMAVELRGEKAVMAIVSDITERKRAEQIQSALYEISQYAYEARDLQALYASVHSTVARLLDCRNFYITLRDENTGLLDWPYFVDEYDWQPEIHSLTDYVLRTGEPLLASPELLSASGNMPAAPTAWLGVPLKNGDNTFGVLAVQSYTTGKTFDRQHQEILTFVGQHLASAIRHRRSEEITRASEQRYRSLFHRAVYGIYRATMDGRIIEANPALATILGYQSPSELLDLNLETQVYLEPLERHRIKKEFAREGRNIHEVRWRRRDGSIITVRLSSAIAPNSGGNADCYEVIVEDITERRDLEEQLRHAQKMEAIVRLAGGLAHDFNNLLTVIKGYSELLLDRFPTGDRGRMQLDEIRKAADRAGTLTGHLLAFSRRQVLSPRVLNINDVISSMEKMLRRLLSEGTELKIMLEPHLGNIKADSGQVEQIIMNLVVNARDAMPQGGELIIDTGNVVVEESEHAVLAPGRYVLLAISDTGIGMDAQTRSHVFEPFFTTKKHGTGLGLSTVYGIAKQSGGHTAISSELGRGTTVKVYLPRVEGVPVTSQPKQADGQELCGTETVLLVEAEDSVRSLVQQVLAQFGYSVIETSSCQEALAVSERHSRPIHLLLTEVALGRESGWELSARLLAVRPEMRVLFMSGAGENTIQSQGVREAGAPLLQKPFTARSIAEKVREVLDNQSLGAGLADLEEER